MPNKTAAFDVEDKERRDCAGKENTADFKRLNTEQSCNSFREKLMGKLFKDGREKVHWKYLYYTIKCFGIYASKTTIWNLFLDIDRKVRTEAEDLDPKLEKLSEIFFPRDVTQERANFLFHMTESYKHWKTKRVRRWHTDMLEDMITRKFLQGKGCNFFCTKLIAIFTILLTTMAVFPIGEGIFNTKILCRVVLVTYSIAWLWYLFSILGERWYPSTYGGLAINSFFMLASFVFCVLFFHYVANPGYYDGRGCFKCPVCTETTDKLCYEYSRFYESINGEFAEANTCSCALVERLRINEPIIPYGESEKYCGGDDCTCDAILGSIENWSGSYTCVYFAPAGTTFFMFGTITGILLLMDFILSLTAFIYWIMMWLGCGRGQFRGCVCCGIDFDLEQQRAMARLKRVAVPTKLE